VDRQTDRDRTATAYTMLAHSATCGKNERHTRLLEVGTRLCDAPADFGCPRGVDAGVRVLLLSSGGTTE